MTACVMRMTCNDMRSEELRVLNLPMGNVIDENTEVLWASSTGSTLVVYEPPGHATRIAIVRDGQLTLLPRLPRFGKVFPGAAW